MNTQVSGLCWLY